MYKPSSISADRQTSALKDEVDDIEKLIITWISMKPVLIDALENSPVCHYIRFALLRKAPREWHSNCHLRIALPPIFCSQITYTWDQYDCINSCADIRCTTQCPLEGTLICCIYRVSQEECPRLRESVPYVKVYRYNPKHLCPKLNGYGDNGQRSLKLWQLLLTYWLPNTY